MTGAPRLRYEDLPREIPIFPLNGVLLLPRGQLPLNIFEPRYLTMVNDAISGSRLIGMVQTKDDGAIYSIGCAGRITSFNETSDGRNEIVLTGVCRFKISEELAQRNGYRRVNSDWRDFEKDMLPVTVLDIDRAKLTKLLKNYFERHGLTCSWEAVDMAADDKLMTTLAMICPFSAKEKQALLEAPCCKDRAKLFMTLLEMECSGECSHSH